MMQSHSSLCLEGSHTWSLMLCSFCFKIHNNLSLNLCFVDEVRSNNSMQPGLTLGSYMVCLLLPPCITGMGSQSPAHLPLMSQALPDLLFPPCPAQGGDHVALRGRGLCCAVSLYPPPTPDGPGRGHREGQIRWVPQNISRVEQGRSCSHSGLAGPQHI